MKKNTFLILLLPWLVIKTQAQSFESDSVYYTPIPKTNKVHTTNISNDSIIIEKRIDYFFNLQVGSFIGCNDCSERKEVTFGASTTHGITIGEKLRVGAGFGFDSYYNWNTLPVFGSVSWDLFGSKNKNALFVQFDYGWAKPWANSSVKDYGYKSSSGGRMILAQVGYRIKYHDMRIAFAVASKFQRANAYYEYPTFIFIGDGTVIEDEPSTKSIEQNMSRLMFSMIVGWK